MFLGKVVGTVWSTKKTPDLEGVRFLIVHPYDLDKEPTRNIVVVADRLGAGTGERVMCAFGKAARSAIGNQDMSIEAAVVGIVDRVDINETLSDEMREAANRLAQENGRPQGIVDLRLTISDLKTTRIFQWAIAIANQTITNQQSPNGQ